MINKLATNFIIFNIFLTLACKPLSVGLSTCLVLGVMIGVHAYGLHENERMNINPKEKMSEKERNWLPCHVGLELMLLNSEQNEKKIER